MDEILSLLKPGMAFNSWVDVSNYLNFKDKRATVIEGKLKHYCDFHKENKKVFIDNVFNEVKPFKTMDFIYEIGQSIRVNTGEYKIVDRFYDANPNRPNTKCRWYLCKCETHDYIFKLTEKRIKEGIGCPLCGNRKLISGVRTLYDIHPEILKYLVNPDDAKLVTPKSGKYIRCRCPVCGSTKEIMVSNLVSHGFSCSVCSDNLSYPNKFVRCFLNQLNIKFFVEHSFDWSQSKIYDQYIESLEMIIENHGEQHYKESSLTSRSLKEEQENDDLKKKLAKTNGIKHYIVLDCRKSSYEWIRDSIMRSELPHLLGFKIEDIDWFKCDAFARSSLVINIWEDWNLFHDLDYLSLKYKIGKRTITSHIQSGYNIGKCDMTVEQHYENAKPMMANDVHCKPIYCETDDIYFKSRKEVGDYYQNIFTRTGQHSLYMYINNNRPYKGKVFKYITKERFNELKTLSKADNSIHVIGDYYDVKYLRS